MGKLDVLIKDFNKHFKEQIAARGIQRIHVDKIPFSSPRATYMLYGGLPRGRIVEFAGEENGGKTTSALDAVANAQKLFKEEWQQEIDDLEAIEKRKKEQDARLTYLKSRGPKQAVYLDCENTLDEDWARLLGVAVDEMMVIKPMSQTAEQLFEMVLQIIETDEAGIVVIDSLGVMLSSQAYEKSMEEKTYGGIAAPLTLFSKKAELLCIKYNCTLIGINQMREDMKSPYGGMTTTGGKGWKHNCSLRLMFQKGSFIDESCNEIKRSSESPAGNLVSINIAKTKICKPDRRIGFYTLNYTYGIDVLNDTVELAIKYGIINKAGAWFTFVDIETGEFITDDEDEIIKLQGKANVLEYLQDNEHLFEEIRTKLNQLIS